jgi:hypothetical protein
VVITKPPIHVAVNSFEEGVDLTLLLLIAVSYTLLRLGLSEADKPDALEDFVEADTSLITCILRLMEGLSGDIASQCFSTGCHAAGGAINDVKRGVEACLFGLGVLLEESAGHCSSVSF